MPRPKILVVDDEVEFAATLVERLLLRNYDAQAVYCAEDAFAIVNSNPVEVVLLDIKMPGIEGIDFLKTIKEFRQNVEVIIVTGHGDPNYAEKAMEAGAFDYVVKPFDISDLTAKIKKAAEKSYAGPRNNPPGEIDGD